MNSSTDADNVQLFKHFFAEAKKPPVFDVPLKPVSVDEGDKLTLRCHICGTPPLKIQWMKDRRELTSVGSTRISFSDGTACLEISPASKHDAGDYLCKATNDAGNEFCKAKVTVKGKSSLKKSITKSYAGSFLRTQETNDKWSCFTPLQKNQEHLQLLLRLQLLLQSKNWRICFSLRNLKLHMSLRVRRNV